MGASFHDPTPDPYDIDDSDRHREDILTGQTDLWDAVDAEMDYADDEPLCLVEIAGQINIFGSVHPGGPSIGYGSPVWCRLLPSETSQEGRRATQTAKRYPQAHHPPKGNT